MELHSSKRIKAESEPSSSHQELVGSNLLHDVTSLDNFSSLSNNGDSNPNLNFEALRWTSSFVDKTMLIRSIMKDEHKLLLTAPPKFGKTMAKNMLQMFLEIGDSEQLLKKYKLFKDLKIYKCTEECTDNHDCESKKFFRQHCGRYPVMSLDFGELSLSTFSTLLGCFRRMIRRQFQKYEYLIHKDAEKYTWSSKNMENMNIDSFLRYLAPPEEDNYWMMANDGVKQAYIFRAFRYLIEVLSTHYNHKLIIVLIDGFDAPFMELLFGDYTDEIVFSSIRDLMRLLCKDELSAQYVSRVVIFSVTTMGGSMFSLGANNVVQRRFLDKNYDYYKFFGFTNGEVEALVKSNVTESQRQKVALDEIALWYNYTIIGDNDTTICNPVSITKYLQNLVRKNYWVDSVGTKCVCQLLKFEKIQEKVFHAIREDDNISIQLYTRIIHLDNISDLKELSESILNCIDNNQVDLALQFLAECGYFNIKKSWNRTLQIPNQELKETFTDKLYHALLNSKTNLFDVKQQESFVNALESLACGNEHEAMKYVTFKKSVENLYTNRELPKAHFHFHCDLWMLILGSGKFHHFSELPVKKGWSPKLDIIIITKSGTGIVIEVKRDERDSAKEGLKQCLKKEYYKVFELEENRGRVVNTIVMGLHLSNNSKVSIRYLENFESKTLSDEQNKETLLKTIVENSYECADI